MKERKKKKKKKRKFREIFQKKKIKLRIFNWKLTRR